MEFRKIQVIGKIQNVYGNQVEFGKNQKYMWNSEKFKKTGNIPNVYGNQVEFGKNQKYM